MLAAKLDLLMKRLDERAAEKDAVRDTFKAMYSHMTCEVCGEVGHSRNDCLIAMKKLPSSTTGFANKEVITGGTINPVHLSKVIQTITPITI